MISLSTEFEFLNLPNKMSYIPFRIKLIQDLLLKYIFLDMSSSTTFFLRIFFLYVQSDYLNLCSKGSQKIK